MTTEKVREYMRSIGLEDRIKEFDVSSATVELAAEAVGVIPARICKTLTFKDPKNEDGCILIQAAGDTKIQNGKFKRFFGGKASMLSPDEVKEYTGHEVGGVCAFALAQPDKVKVYADVSLQRFDTVFPAAGTDASAIELTCDELFDSSKALEWIDVCKIPEEEAK